MTVTYKLLPIVSTCYCNMQISPFGINKLLNLVIRIYYDRVDTFLCDLLFMFLRDSPTRLDREVLSAIEGIEVDPQKFPSIHKWKSTMVSYSASEMQRLVSLFL